jgi:hypothetical protein
LPTYPFVCRPLHPLPGLAILSFLHSCPSPYCRSKLAAGVRGNVGYVPGPEAGLTQAAVPRLSECSRFAQQSNVALYSLPCRMPKLEAKIDTSNASMRRLVFHLLVDGYESRWLSCASGVVVFNHNVHPSPVGHFSLISIVCHSSTQISQVLTWRELLVTAEVV